MAAGSGAYDIFMTGPSVVWSYVPAGWLEPLDDYINDPEKTDQEWWDFDDFYPKLIDSLSRK